MLVNHVKRLIYLDHPRTASTSMTDYLKQPELGFEIRYTAHKVPKEVDLLHPWDTYTKFTTIREHEDIIRSWIIRRNEEDPPPAPWGVEVIEKALEEPLAPGWITKRQMFPMVDYAHYLIRFEHLWEDLEELLLGFNFEPYPRNFPHVHGEWAKKTPDVGILFTPAAQRYIRERFADEMQYLWELVDAGYFRVAYRTSKPQPLRSAFLYQVQRIIRGKPRHLGRVRD